MLYHSAGEPYLGSQTLPKLLTICRGSRWIKLVVGAIPVEPNSPRVELYKEAQRIEPSS